MAAMDEPRVLCIGSEVHDDVGVIVSVADTGAGIGLRDFERIFDPLFTTKSGGMGMGLSICRSIIEAHDGRLWAAPNTPRGAAFQFVLHADTAARGGVSTGSVAAPASPHAPSPPQRAPEARDARTNQESEHKRDIRHAEGHQPQHDLRRPLMPADLTRDAP
jgi:Histidine kinase-, DNA gyrase B-, and HSP90-like ATPase